MSEGVVGCSSSVRSEDIAAASLGLALRRVIRGFGSAFLPKGFSNAESGCERCLVNLHRESHA